MKKKKLKMILWLALAVSLCAAVMQAGAGRQAAAEQAAAFQVAGLVKKETAEEGGHSARPTVLPAAAAALADIDLAALRAVNEDVIGWLEIPDTPVSYPLLQGPDNQYYLSHSWTKERSSAGAVFLEETNSRDLTDYHLIAYAHRLRSDIMFTSLKYYSDPAYYQAHPSIYLFDGRQVRRYDIFAAHEAGVTSLVYRLDLEEKQLQQELIDFCLANSVIETGVEPGAEEQLLTLSTCTGHGHEARWVVQGVLRERYEIPTGGGDPEERSIP